MTLFDAVLFDLDGTLCRRTQNTQELSEHAFERAGKTDFGQPDALWTALDGPPDHDDPVGYFGAGFVRVAAQHGRSDVDTLALACALLNATDDGDVTLLPGVEDALESVAAVGAVGLVTNGPEDRQRAKLDALGIVDQFDTIVYGAELVRSKPHTTPFDRALDDLAVARERTLYVGPSLAYDVAGGQNAGLSVAWLHGDEDAGAYEPEYGIDSLAELPAILRTDR